MTQEDLKSWVQKELVSNTDASEKILSEHKERIKELISIKSDGKVVVFKPDLPAKLMVGLYLVGAAYARVAELRKDDSVTNLEIGEQLKMKGDTVRPKLKELRDEGLAIQIGDGLHRINYPKIKNLLQEMKP